MAEMGSSPVHRMPMEQDPRDLATGATSPREPGRNMAGSTSPATGVRPDGRPGRPFAFYLALLVAVFVASAAAAVVYVQVQTTRDARRQAQADATFAANAAAKQLGSDIALVKTTVANLAANPSIATVVAHPAGCTLTFGGPDNASQGHVDIVRADGVVVCSSRKPGSDGKLAGYAGEGWVRAAMAKTLFRAPFRDTITKRDGVLYAVPGAGKALVAAVVDLASVGPGLKAIYGGGRPTEFLVLRDSRTVITRSVDPRRWVGASIAGTKFAQAGDAVERTDLDGVRRVYASAPVAGTPWRLFVGEDKALALASATRLRNRQLEIVLGSLALILLVMTFVYRRTVLPVKRLSAGVKRTAAQDHDAPVPVAGPAEVAELAQEINTLIASVNAQEIVRAAKEEAERANEAKSTFLSHMSHELRTPLAAILGFAELLHRETSDEQHRVWSRHVLEGGRHLLELVNELLEISQIEAGKMVLVTGPVDVSRAIGEVLDLMAPIAGSAGVRLERSGESFDLTALADPMRLKQVLLNLVSNAVKYNSEAGTVTVAVEKADDQMVRIAVTDTGKGMSAEKLARLFNPFERLGAAEGTVGGSGLGLVVTSGLVAAMGGRLDVASEVGRGTTFAIELPLADAAHETGTVKRKVPRPERVAGKIIYIDDNPANLALVENLLGELRPGLEVRTTALGTEGARFAEDSRPDLLLLDLNLPDIAGEEVLRRIRARAATADVPVVILSADSTSRNITRLLQSGADAYMTKPFDADEFLGLVDRLLPTD
jgi:signal transduction histidine kinase